MTSSAPKTSPKTSHTSLLIIFTSWHHVPDVLDSESRVFIFGVDPNHTETQPVHGQDGSAWQRGPRDSRPGKDTKSINTLNQTNGLGVRWHSNRNRCIQCLCFAQSFQIVMAQGSPPKGATFSIPKELCSRAVQLLCQLIISPHGKPQLPGHMIAGLFLTEGSNGQKQSMRMSKGSQISDSEQPDCQAVEIRRKKSSTRALLSCHTAQKSLGSQEGSLTAQ